MRLEPKKVLKKCKSQGSSVFFANSRRRLLTRKFHSNKTRSKFHPVFVVFFFIKTLNDILEEITHV